MLHREGLTLPCKNYTCDRHAGVPLYRVQLNFEFKSAWYAPVLTCRQLIQLHMASMQRFSDTLELSKYPLARTCRGLSCTVDNYLTPLQGVALFLVDSCAVLCTFCYCCVVKNISAGVQH